LGRIRIAFLASNLQRSPRSISPWDVKWKRFVVGISHAVRTSSEDVGRFLLESRLGVCAGGFIYSDLMVPPLVKINAKYYGWRVALYIAAVMFVSIVATALILHYSFYFFGLTPESARKVEEVTQFKVDYTLFLNVAAVLIVVAMAWLGRRHGRDQQGGGSQDHNAKWSLQDVVTTLAIVWLAGGLAAFALRAC
jgi:hypothetical protein